MMASGASEESTCSSTAQAGDTLVLIIVFECRAKCICVCSPHNLPMDWGQNLHARIGRHMLVDVSDNVSCCKIHAPSGDAMSQNLLPLTGRQPSMLLETAPMLAQAPATPQNLST